MRELFADVLDGHEVLANNSRWVSFTTVRNERWFHDNVVLLGDAAHTAHFSIGSGTKLAMEDALALAACLHESPDLADALGAYEEERKAVVVSTQRAAQASLEWFENLGQYTHQHPVQFAFNILTRSRRITYDNLRLRDPEFIARVDEWFAATQLEAGYGTGEPGPPMFAPFRLGQLDLANRVVVSPMDMYVSKDGMPGDFHLVHLGGKALGGAGLVMTEMVCVSPRARITPGCAGLWSDEQGTAWQRICDFVHASSPARIGIQLGHSGPKGSTKLMWEGMDQPLPEGNWPAGLGLRSALQGRRQPDPVGTGPSRHGRRGRRLRVGGRAGCGGGLRPAGAPLRTRLPAVVIPVPGDQPSHRRVRRRRHQPAALPARGVRRGARGRGRPTDP